MTSWLPVSTEGRTGDSAEGRTEYARVLGLRPNLAAHVADFTARLWDPSVGDPVILELCRLRTAQLLGCDAETAVRSRPAVEAGLTEGMVTALPSWPTDPRFDDRARACLGFAELFVMDPAAIGADGAAEVSAAVGFPGLVGLANAQAVWDGFTRFRLVLGIGPDAPGVRVVDVDTPDPTAPAPRDPADADPDDAVANSPLAAQPALLDSFQRLYAVLWSRGVVDHPSKEVARLRNARVTGCRFCRNVRFAQARQDGLTEDLVELIDDGYAGSALPDRHKAVLRLADAFLRDPACGLAEDARAELLAHYGPDGVVELTAGLALFMGFSKIAVSLGTAPEDFPTMVIPTPDLEPVAG